ncbi:MAG: hypothetical protein HY763_11305 [Planctomycetes bacterium]|nr:hypothetical protein [Planctomycetota bacterium]
MAQSGWDVASACDRVSGLAPRLRERHAVAVVLAAFLGSGGTLRGQPSPTSIVHPSSARVVHQFDFDERKEGNLEELPKYWEPFRSAGFPRYAEGSFDFHLGHSAPPSLHLESQGRNVAYQYRGADTPARAGTEYRIEGFVRCDRLVHARAALSAHYLDKGGRPLATSLVRSRYFGGPGEPDAWTRAELFLPPAPDEARTVGIVVWVLQESTWSVSVPGVRHLSMVDVHAGAWFDDITVFALPRLHLSTSSPGNVMTPAGLQELRVLLADDDSGLTARLSLRDQSGALVGTHSIGVSSEAAPTSHALPVGDLPIGRYHATMDVSAGQDVVLTRSLTFAKVAPAQRKCESGTRAFGVVIDPQTRSDRDAEGDLLRALGVRSVKLPVWSGDADETAAASDRWTADRWLKELTKDGFALTGVFAQAPAAFAPSDGAVPRGLLELLADDATAWRDHLAAVVAPHASVYRRWQVGADGSPAGVADPHLAAALEHVREEMRRFTTAPQLVATASTDLEPPQQSLGVEGLSLLVGENLAADRCLEQIDRWRKAGYDRLAAYVPPLPADHYARLPRLADWAQRLIAARFAGAHPVYAPQPWQVRQGVHSAVTEPGEEFAVLRTIADMLGDSVPTLRLDLAPTARCFVFQEGESVILAAWDVAAPPEGARHSVQLGDAARQVDLWGEAHSLERDEHQRQVLRLTALPVFVDGAERWLVELQSSVTLAPTHVESGTELQRHTLEVPNRSPRPISGEIMLHPPAPWTVTPRRVDFNVAPGRSQSVPLEIRYPHNAAAGARTVRAEITTTDGYYLETFLPVELGLSDVEIAGTAVVQEGYLLLRQAVTNRTGTTLHFRGSAIVPGRERQYRPISNLQPGETQFVEYRFPEGRDLIGATVRVELRETNDGPRVHALELVVP